MTVLLMGENMTCFISRLLARVAAETPHQATNQARFFFCARTTDSPIVRDWKVNILTETKKSFLFVEFHST
jgi:hypothetical protein